MPPRYRAVHLSVWAVAASMTLALSAQTPAFDAASIKPHVGADDGGSMGSPPGQFRATNVRLVQFLGAAWEFPMGPVYGIKGLPKWVNDERFDVDFKWPADTPREQVREMFRGMFAERMKLQVHYEPIDDPSFALSMARSDGRLGRGLTRSTLDCEAVAAATRAGQRMPDLANGAGPCRAWVSNDTILAGGITMEELARHLTNPAGRQVVDRTGLDGRWEFVLHFSRQERDPNAPLGLYPSLFSALQADLGLKLVPFVGTSKLLVIDHMERPTEN